MIPCADPHPADQPRRATVRVRLLEPTTDREVGTLDFCHPHAERFAAPWRRWQRRPLDGSGQR